MCTNIRPSDVGLLSAGEYSVTFCSAAGITSSAHVLPGRELCCYILFVTSLQM